jgi:hypothetical protein
MKNFRFNAIIMIALCAALPVFSEDNDNLCPNGNFSSGEVMTLSGGYMAYRTELEGKWHLIIRPSDGAVARQAVENGKCHVTIKSIGGQDWNIQLCMMPFKIENGKKYRLTFDAKSTKKRKISTAFIKVGYDWNLYGGESIELDAAMKSYKTEFEMKYPTDGRTRLGFDLGSSTEDVWLANVRVVEIVPQM